MLCHIGRVNATTPTRAALVTGASGGIGFAIAEMLAAEDYALTIVSQSEDKIAAAAHKLRSAGATVNAAAADVSDATAMREVVQTHTDNFGRLDVLVNNAGIMIAAPLAEIELKHLHRQVDVNIASVILGYQLCQDLLVTAAQEHGNALVVNLASCTAKAAEPMLGVYSATKAAVLAFTEAMNKELVAQGIKSCAVCPALVETPMTEYVKEHVSSDEMIQPCDIAAMLRALLNLSPGCVVPELIIDRRANIAGVLPPGL